MDLYGFSEYGLPTVRFLFPKSRKNWRMRSAIVGNVPLYLEEVSLFVILEMIPFKWEINLMEFLSLPPAVSRNAWRSGSIC